MRILEVGKYISVSYAGMLLAEQGHHVTKIASVDEPVLQLREGNQLWKWLNEQKELIWRSRDIDLRHYIEVFEPDVVIENVPTLTPMTDIVDKWISIRPTGNIRRSFDAFAQVQAFGDTDTIADFYIGDTIAGLFAAFLATAGNKKHHIVGQAEALQKIIEGELTVEKPEGGWDKKQYSIDADGAHVDYGCGLLHHEWWTREDKLNNLRHRNGRIHFDGESD